MKPSDLVHATQAELDELLALAKVSLPAAPYDLLARVLATYMHVMVTLQNARSSVKRLRQMLFGASTESRAKVLAALGGSTPLSSEAAAAEGAHANQADAQAQSKRAGRKKPAPGHGRKGARAYVGATVVELDELELRPGQCCPQCQRGKVYDSVPRTLVKVTGQPPLAATVYKLARLRCRLCDAVYSAAIPPHLPPDLAQQPKYDAACVSMLAVLRYGCGMPLYRLQGLQQSLGVPLSDATQWDIVSKAVAAPQAVYEALIKHAAQARLLHSDDTCMKVLQLMAARRAAERDGVQPEGKAINTSGIVAFVPDQDQPEHQVVLFFTGHAHAGKNIERLLAQRDSALPTPMQMCDALAANVCGEVAVDLGNCLVHGRRQVVDIAEHFPEAARRVINDLARVYAIDASCAQNALSPEQRLAAHQKDSGPIMVGLHGWMSEQIEDHLVEPNSGLGKALKYFMNHWKELTLFLRQAGAPLDNNVCERALKRAILHRKASMFYKTVNGAKVGDIYMSLIHTCGLCGANPFEYLKALVQHAKRVQAQAAQWLPWNFHEQLATETTTQQLAPSG